MKAIFAILLSFFLCDFALSGEGHDHHEDEHREHKTQNDHDEHGEDDEHEGHDDHHGHGESKTGDGKAIAKVDEKLGIQFHSDSLKRLKFEYKIYSGRIIQIPKNAVVSSQDEFGIYLKEGDFFRFVHVKIKSRQGDLYTVELEERIVKKAVVVNRVGLLRISDVFARDKSEYGHAH